MNNIYAVYTLNVFLLCGMLVPIFAALRFVISNSAFYSDLGEKTT